MENKNSHYGPTVLRVFLGLLFIVPGFMKLLNPAGPAGLLSNIALFAWAPSFWAWVLLLSEIVFGLAVVLGWKTKYTVWPLVVVLAVATIYFAIPNASNNSVSLLFHLVGIAGLISVYLTGPGALALNK